MPKLKLCISHHGTKHFHSSIGHLIPDLLEDTMKALKKT